MSFSTDNKLEGNIEPIFKPDQELWDNWEIKSINKINENYKKKKQKVNRFMKHKSESVGFDLTKEGLLKKKEYLENKILPHEKPLDEIIFECRTVFLNSMELIIEGNYDLAYEYATMDINNLFYTTINIVIIGLLLLVISEMLVE